ncbi:MAG: ATP-binding protein [Pseudanabaena sp. M135S2SP2A07QC]|nr:ATP-binding protein [Pseudanabaena sp. M179S2SP2A07QC]MCA6532082.1 ATP-binding protein [Pseudanabaena sp. M125S2SP2A07QC]MCA6537002.1 ATP-binding protein [Pseudanabaena sp. M176S2SP2A07QC]MCA6541632.1 ATP-binding protein [Pseudanabaena sp. M037S2SP2A07QC]MCA6544608.1 ATP-binding protein [Pseudanabaena sp. M074S1SP2A07QC]MCA6547900.1 ATP-binding protein [Pseudanabaena sp. M152S2SP2A07QC]MCA6554514.1 ATP-binding protein [Pseudanabaena sp. M135S2SP2A07QC]MCA6564995.1 ATP-binding protein [Pse
MIDTIELKNFGPIEQLNWSGLGRINVVIGKNSTGKTFLLKSLYSVMRTIEEYKRGNDQRTASEILVNKLYWTFQTEKIGDLVKKGAESPLSLTMKFDSNAFIYSFGNGTTKSIASLENHVPSPRQSNSIFLPAKEVLSLHHIILKSRDQDQLFGFDDTYVDLVKALVIQPQKGKNHTHFSTARKNLEDILGGKVEYDQGSNRWHFKKGNQKFPIGVTAEGIKKISILDTLLSNRYLDRNSIVFIDEPESALHPEAISKLIDIICVLAESGIQFFLASHSYFVIKKLYLIAQQKKMSIPIISAETWHSEDLQNGMINNPIIDESIRLYREEVDLV